MHMDLLLSGSDEFASIANPKTGEVVLLADATREDIAAWYIWLMEVRGQMERAVRAAERVFIERSDMETTLGVNVDGWRISVPGAGETFVPDVEALRAALLQLVEDGSLTQQAADEACRPHGVECPHCQGFVPTGGYKVSQRALGALRKVKRHATIIDACGEYLQRGRTFHVKKL